MKRLVAIIGDYYHPHDWIKKSLELAMNDLKGNEDFDLVEISSDQIAAELKQQPDCVILFAENRLNPEDDVVNHWMDENVEKAIDEYVENGGGWLAWHSGLASYETEGQYIKMLRGFFKYHPMEHQVVHYSGHLDNEALNFEFKDEHYFVDVDEEHTEVFLRSHSVDGDSIGGWRHTYGTGRVCCLTPAHNQEGLEDPKFLSLLGESLKWIVSK